MKHTRIATAASLVVSMGLLGAATLLAGPAQADPGSDQFLADLGDIGLSGVDPATATAIGQQVCPMLAEPGQRVADVAADVAGALGRPLGPATMFTGLAISIFCPGAVASLADGRSPIALKLFGI